MWCAVNRLAATGSDGRHYIRANVMKRAVDGLAGVPACARGELDVKVLPTQPLRRMKRTGWEMGQVCSAIEVNIEERSRPGGE